MTQLTHDLPEGMVEWIVDTVGGEITRLERHVARREAWVVDVTRPDGSVLEGFLRLERVPADPGSATSLFKETKIIEALGRTSIPAATTTCTAPCSSGCGVAPTSTSSPTRASSAR
jgi:hypothetical protein